MSARGKLPVLLRLVQARQKTSLLFFLGNIQKKLADHHAVSREIAFEAVDNIFEAFLPDILGHQFLRNALSCQYFRGKGCTRTTSTSSSYERLKIPIRPRSGMRCHRPPHVVVIKFFGGRRFEGKNLAALWINARHYMLDRAVFPGRVHRLKNQQQRVTILRVELVLDSAKASTPLASACLARGLSSSFV